MLKETPTGGLLHDPVIARSHEAHNRAHTFYQTACVGDCELESMWAARRLITPTGFLTAARESRGLKDMADVLDVLPIDVCNYMAALNPDEWLIMVRLTGITGSCVP